MNAYQSASAGAAGWVRNEDLRFWRDSAIQHFLRRIERLDAIAGIGVDTNGKRLRPRQNTLSIDFPVANALHILHTRRASGFVTKLTPSGEACWCTAPFLGGSGGGLALPEMVNGIAVDTSGAAYLAGVTSSTNFPVSTPLPGA